MGEEDRVGKSGFPLPFSSEKNRSKKIHVYLLLYNWLSKLMGLKELFALKLNGRKMELAIFIAWHDQPFLHHRGQFEK